MLPARDETKPQFARTAIALICDDRARGEQLLEAIDLPGRPIFDTQSRDGGWESMPARTLVFWEEDPDLSRLRRRIRVCRGRARVVVIIAADQTEGIELALREGATVITEPDSDGVLACELELCLDPGDASVLVEARELTARLDKVLSRKLHRHSPRVRFSGPGRVDALVNRIAQLVLAEARGLAAASDAPIQDLDWETMSTAVQTKEESGRFRKRAAEGAPDRDPVFVDDAQTVPIERVKQDTPRDVDFAETGPYAPPELELIEEVGRAAQAPRSVPPPIPPAARQAVTVPAKPRRGRRWLAFTTLFGLAVAGLAGAGWLLVSPVDVAAVAPEPSPELAALAAAASVEEPPEAAPEAAPAPAPAAADELELIAEVAPEPELRRVAMPDRRERARRASIRARAHQRVGRYERALGSARLAVRLAPQIDAHRALLEELEDQVGAVEGVVEEVTAPEESETLDE